MFVERITFQKHEFSPDDKPKPCLNDILEET